jgi:cell division septation protein DedD
MLEQAQPDSGESGSLPLEDRVSNALFGTPKPKAPQQEPEQTQEATEAEASAEPTEPVEETFEYEAEGEKYVLPKKLEKSFMQERDYTQKSQALAEQRRLVEHSLQQSKIKELQGKFDNEIANEVRQIQLIDQVLDQQVDWRSMSTDDALRHKLELDNLEKQKAKLREGIQQKWGQFRQQTEQQRTELLEKAREVLKKRIPTWSDDVAKQIREHAKVEGYNDAELNTLEDPRHAITLWKAMQFDQLQAKATPAVTQAKTVKTTSAKPMPPATKDYLNYRKALGKTAENSPERRKVVEQRVASIFGK